MVLVSVSLDLPNVILGYNQDVTFDGNAQVENGLTVSGDPVELIAQLTGTSILAQPLGAHGAGAPWVQAAGESVGLTGAGGTTNLAASSGVVHH